MVDLHLHTLLSDGELLPSELIRYIKAKGLEGCCFTDHVDFSNLEYVVTRNIQAVSNLKLHYPEIKLLTGAELTHIPPKAIVESVNKLKDMGVELLIVHGETIGEPVPEGTNLAAIEAKVDILAHPGLISEEEVEKAAEKGVYLELTSRVPHAYTNGHIVRLAKKYNAKLIFSTDAHKGEDVLSEFEASRICIGAGLTDKEVKDIFKNAEEIISSKKI